MTTINSNNYSNKTTNVDKGKTFGLFTSDENWNILLYRELYITMQVTDFDLPFQIVHILKYFMQTSVSFLRNGNATAIPLKYLQMPLYSKMTIYRSLRDVTWRQLARHSVQCGDDLWLFLSELAKCQPGNTQNGRTVPPVANLMADSELGSPDSYLSFVATIRLSRRYSHDIQTDRRTDRRTMRIITIAGPHIVAGQLIQCNKHLQQMQFVKQCGTNWKWHSYHNLQMKDMWQENRSH